MYDIKINDSRFYINKIEKIKQTNTFIRRDMENGNKYTNAKDKPRKLRFKNNRIVCTRKGIYEVDDKGRTVRLIFSFKNKKRISLADSLVINSVIRTNETATCLNNKLIRISETISALVTSCNKVLTDISKNDFAYYTITNLLKKNEKILKIAGISLTKLNTLNFNENIFQRNGNENYEELKKSVEKENGVIHILSAILKL